MTRQFVKFVSRQFGNSGSIRWPSGPNRLSRHSNMFTASKAAQMAAVFVQRHGNTINLLKLMKLLYFADRESIAKYGFPISYDHIVSMVRSRRSHPRLDFVRGARSSKGWWKVRT